MKAQHTLQVFRREKIGSRYAKRDRAAGKLPAVLYGHGKDPVSLCLDHKEAVRFFHSGERVFDIEVKDENVTQTVMLKDIQFDYLGDNPVHVDLTRVDMDEEVEAHVAINFVGEAPGLKHAGAIFNHPLQSLHIKGAVRILPEQIDVDLTALDVDSPVRAGDIKMPAGIQLLADEDTTVASITIKAEQTESAEAEDVEGAPAQPEVITEKKEDKEEEG
ncbi:MAG: 50S ribosomal protein L25 [Planctomycetaceae bacterium]|nr:50S ribosomal protein L25 [Planctomycetaceae bacterium]